MLAYIVRRLLLMIPTVLLVTIIVFFATQVIPGSYVDQILAQYEYQYQESDIQAIKEALGVDVPLHVQYLRWMDNVVHGNLGDSLWTGKPVLQDMLTRLPVSIELGILGIIIGLIIALPIGAYSALRQDTFGDYVGRSIAIGFVAIPNFWVAILIIVLPAVWWGWSTSYIYIPFFENPLANLRQFIIPAFVIGMGLSGVTMRMQRTMMLEVLRQDYIRTAWAKGLKERTIVVRHVLKNALIPVITILGLQLPMLIGGTVIIENIFSLPGIGRYLLAAIQHRDYIAISGVNLVICTFVLLVNLAVDLAYTFLNPKIRYR
jgi:peptide/nickel transport system permease protein